MALLNESDISLKVLGANEMKNVTKNVKNPKNSNLINISCLHTNIGSNDYNNDDVYNNITNNSVIVNALTNRAINNLNKSTNGSIYNGKITIANTNDMIKNSSVVMPNINRSKNNYVANKYNNINTNNDDLKSNNININKNKHFINDKILEDNQNEIKLASSILNESNNDNFNLINDAPLTATSFSSVASFSSFCNAKYSVNCCISSAAPANLSVNNTNVTYRGKKKNNSISIIHRKRDMNTINIENNTINEKQSIDKFTNLHSNDAEMNVTNFTEMKLNENNDGDFISTKCSLQRKQSFLFPPVSSSSCSLVFSSLTESTSSSDLITSFASTSSSFTFTATSSLASSNRSSSTNQFTKTKICPFFLQGVCLHQSNTCTFAHSQNELRLLPDLRHTKLCEYTKKKMKCPLNDKCTYAHSFNELKPSAHLQTFKTSLCFFWKNGTCYNGHKCRFAHGSNEMRKKQTEEEVENENKKKVNLNTNKDNPYFEKINKPIVNKKNEFINSLIKRSVADDLNDNFYYSSTTVNSNSTKSVKNNDSIEKNISNETFYNDVNKNNYDVVNMNNKVKNRMCCSNENDSLETTEDSIFSKCKSPSGSCSYCNSNDLCSIANINEIKNDSLDNDGKSLFNAFIASLSLSPSQRFKINDSSCPIDELAGKDKKLKIENKIQDENKLNENTLNFLKDYSTKNYLNVLSSLLETGEDTSTELFDSMTPKRIQNDSINNNFINERNCLYHPNVSSFDLTHLIVPSQSSSFSDKCNFNFFSSALYNTSEYLLSSSATSIKGSPCFASFSEKAALNSSSFSSLSSPWTFLDFDMQKVLSKQEKEEISRKKTENHEICKVPEGKDVSDLCLCCQSFSSENNSSDDSHYFNLQKKNTCNVFNSNCCAENTKDFFSFIDNTDNGKFKNEYEAPYEIKPLKKKMATTLNTVTDSKLDEITEKSKIFNQDINASNNNNKDTIFSKENDKNYKITNKEQAIFKLFLMFVSLKNECEKIKEGNISEESIYNSENFIKFFNFLNSQSSLSSALQTISNYSKSIVDTSLSSLTSVVNSSHSSTADFFLSPVSSSNCCIINEHDQTDLLKNSNSLCDFFSSSVELPSLSSSSSLSLTKFDPIIHHSAVSASAHSSFSPITFPSSYASEYNLFNNTASCLFFMQSKSSFSKKMNMNNSNNNKSIFTNNNDTVNNTNNTDTNTNNNLNCKSMDDISLNIINTNNNNASITNIQKNTNNICFFNHSNNKKIVDSSNISEKIESYLKKKDQITLQTYNNEKNQKLWKETEETKSKNSENMPVVYLSHAVNSDGNNSNTCQSSYKNETPNNFLTINKNDIKYNNTVSCDDRRNFNTYNDNSDKLINNRNVWLSSTASSSPDSSSPPSPFLSPQHFFLPFLPFLQ